jgi:hypothetical protein
MLRTGRSESAMLPTPRGQRIEEADAVDGSPILSCYDASHAGRGGPKLANQVQKPNLVREAPSTVALCDGLPATVSRTRFAGFALRGMSYLRSFGRLD